MVAAAKTLDWRPARPTEMEAISEDGQRLKVKQSIGKISDLTFWYCWRNGQYLGVEKDLSLAQSRAMSGRMRMPSSELEEWLKRVSEDLPPDLLASEQKRLAEWKKNPNSKKLTEPAPAERATLTTSGGSDAGSKSAKATTGGAARPASTAPVKHGKIAQSAVVRVVKKAPTGKAGTKWRTRQEHVFAMDGKTVAEVKDNDAVKHMLEDGTIKLEEK